MGDKLYINGTKVHEVDAIVASPAGYGTITAVELDFGTPNQETFLDPRSLADGVRFNGTVTKDRPFRVRLLVQAPTVAKGQDEWAEIVGSLANVAQGLISFRYDRTDGTGGAVSRELLAILTAEPAWAWVDEGGGDGLRPSGDIVIGLECVAPFPWWRDVTETTETDTFSGTSSGEIVITRPGHVACGCQIKVATAGTLASLAVGDGVNTMSMTATFGASAKGVDWYYTDPSATSIDSGVVISDTSHISLHSAETTLALVPPGTGSGDHTVTVKYKALWKAP